MAEPQHTHSQAEMWKPVVGYEKYYEISSHGRIRSKDRPVWNGKAWYTLPGRILKTGNEGHYPRIVLRGESGEKKFYIHELVLTHFVGPRPDGHYGRHLDDCKTNNHVENLEWGTPSQNSYDKVRNGNDHYAKRTHCKNGHEFTPENTRTNPRSPGTRHCQECKHESYLRGGKRTDEQRREYARRIANGHIPKRVQKTCKRGHLLEEPNLMPSQLPERECLACSRGRSAARRYNDKENLQRYCDEYYSAIMN